MGAYKTLLCIQAILCYQISLSITSKVNSVSLQLVLGAIEAGFSFPCQPFDSNKDPGSIRVNVTIYHA